MNIKITISNVLKYLLLLILILGCIQHLFLLFILSFGEDQQKNRYALYSGNTFIWNMTGENFISRYNDDNKFNDITFDSKYTVSGRTNYGILGLLRIDNYSKEYLYDVYIQADNYNLCFEKDVVGIDVCIPDNYNYYILNYQ